MPEITEREQVYNGELIQVEVLHEAAQHDGALQQREVVRHQPGVAVVLLQPRSDLEGAGHQVVMVQHHRTAIGEELLELVAGMVDEGESPLEAAKREVREEVGMEARQWVELGTLYSSPGFTDEAITLFVARQLRRVAGARDESEQLALCTVPLTLALEQIQQGELRDMKSVAGLLWAANFLQSEQASANSEG